MTLFLVVIAFALGFVVAKLFFTKGQTPLTGLQELTKMAEQAFTDLATQIEALKPAYQAKEDKAVSDAVAAKQAELDAANQQLSALQAASADNAQVIGQAVADVTPAA